MAGHMYGSKRRTETAGSNKVGPNRPKEDGPDRGGAGGVDGRLGTTASVPAQSLPVTHDV